eukprot:COSAG04_NODE_4289_length_2181_cov_11.770413_1_plen_114_part_10
MDIVIRFRTAFRDDITGYMVMEPAKIAWQFCTRLLVVDLLAVLPCIWAFFPAGTSFEPPLFVQAGGCRMIKLVRVLDPDFRGKSIPRFVHLAGERGAGGARLRWFSPPSEKREE